MNTGKPTHQRTTLRGWHSGLAGLVLAAMAGLAQSSVTVDNVPLNAVSTVPSNLVLVPSVEWPTVITQANDPAVAETTASYNTANAYVGYFNPNLCYAYHYDAIETNRYFYPVSAVNSTGTAHSCSGQTGGTAPDPTTQKLWSGNFMNWATMQAIDTFRLALTGGYRVNRPADGNPPNVSITDSSGNTTSYATSEQPGVTYLEKATSDRWTTQWTKLRSLPANIADATPSQATVSSPNRFRTRIGGLRSQMWFIPSSSAASSDTGDLGAGGSCCNQTNFIPLPVSDSSQTDNSSPAITAIPYNPGAPNNMSLPNSATTTTTNSTACAAGEYGCSSTTAICSTGTVSGADCVTTAVTSSVTTNLIACPATNGGFSFYRAGDSRAIQNSSGSASSVANSCPSGSTTTAGAVTTTITVTPPSSSEPSSTPSTKTCTVVTTVTTATTHTGAAIPQYIHTTYGSNQIYAVSVRVKVCDGTLDTRSLCTQYGSHYKPEGLLQNNASQTRYSVFSYMMETGQVRNGGVMRARQKLISPVTSGEKPYPDRANRIAGVDNPEWDSATGVFLNNPDPTDASVTTTSIGGCSTTTGAPDGSGCKIQYSGVINYINRFGQLLTGQGSLKTFDNLSELYYTALLYLRGLANSSAFSNLATLSGTNIQNPSTAQGKYENADGFPVIENWYNTGANTAVTSWNASGTTPARTTGTDYDPMLYSCQTTVVLGIGDTHTNGEDNAYSSDATANGATWRTYTDASGTTNTRLNLAGLAYWAHLNDLRGDVPNTAVAGGSTASAARGQTISTYWVDVVEQSQLYNATGGTANQYYNATKYGGYTIPLADWDSNGNAMAGSTTTPPHSDASQHAWFESNTNTWTAATANIGTILTSALGFSGGDYKEPSNMFFGNNGQAMIDGLNAAFNKIAADVAGSGASLAANSTKLDTGTTTYQASYLSGQWTGELKAFTVNPSTGVIATTPSWTVSALLPSWDTSATPHRNIFTTSNGTAQVSFDTTNTPTALQSALDLTTGLGSTATAANIINYLRGNQSMEKGNSGGIFRTRSKLLGDIVDSQPVFVGSPDANLFNNKTFTGSGSYVAFAATNASRSKRIWVASNDGMLHAFNADTSGSNPAPGQETYAYLPSAVIKAGIKNLSQPTYGGNAYPHQYYNDGELTVADVYFNSAWHSVLVGTTGRGPAKAIYALDVTDPASPSLLWERSSGDGNTSDSNSGYIGQVVGKPVIAQTSAANTTTGNGNWSVLIGNGYNSSQNQAALLQFDIQTGVLSVHTAGTSTNNGLAAPGVWIATPSNGISTAAFAGDLNGLVWSFDLSSNSSAGTAIFTAKNGAGTAQPITSGMLVGKDPDPSKGDLWVFFGTGSLLSQSNLANMTTANQVQSWYGIIVQGGTSARDSSLAVKAAATNDRSLLAERKITVQTSPSLTSLAARGITVTDNLSGKKGWFIDLVAPNPPGTAYTGERMVTPNQFQGSLLLGTTRVPGSGSSDPCNSSSGTGWIMAINPFTGAPPSATFFDINQDNNFTDSDKITQNGVTYIAAGVGFSAAANNPIFVGNTMLISFDNATTGKLNTAGTIGTLQRLSWRELIAQ